MKYIIFLADGAADYPVPELGNKTPLQVAKKPAIDRIARLGRCGSFVTVDDDMPPGSEVANLTVLGYNAHECYQGRGVIEAASMGVKLNDTDIAMRCNLICIADGRIKNHSAGHISTEEAHKLIRYIDRYIGGDDAHFFPGISYRHLLLLSEPPPPLDPSIPRSLGPSFSTDFECSPPHDHVGEKVEDLMIVAKSDEAKPTVARLNQMIRTSWELLPRHKVNQERVKAGKDPANSIWLWSQGRKPKMKTLKEQYGITGAVISAVDLIKGLGVYAGLDVIDVPGATGLIDTNYEGKADACLEALADHDFVYVHVEATDEAGHSRDVKQKVRGIEYLDSRLVARVMKGIENGDCTGLRPHPRGRGLSSFSPVTVAVLPDHLTPVATGNHVHGPVPVAILTPGVAPDSVQTYDEAACVLGSLGQLHGDQFIRTVLGR